MTDERRPGVASAHEKPPTIDRTHEGASGAVRFTVTGPLSPDELRDALSDLYATHDPERPKRFLWDMRAAEVSWSADEIRDFAGWVSANRQPGAGRTAVVVGRDFHFGLARMYEVFSADLPVEFVVFRDMESALAWIDH